MISNAQLLRVSAVKGLAEVTEKQARGQPHLQNVLFGGKKRRKRNKKSGKESGGEITSESDEENTVPAKRQSDLMRLSQRPSVQRQEKEPVIPEQIEPSRILEQSMATAEVSLSNAN